MYPKLLGPSVGSFMSVCLSWARFPKKHILRPGSKCKQFIWKVTPRNNGGGGGEGIVRQERKAANQVTAVAPGASSYLETGDSRGQASGSPTRVERSKGFYPPGSTGHWLRTEGHGGQGEGDSP